MVDTAKGCIFKSMGMKKGKERKWVGRWVVWDLYLNLMQTHSHPFAEFSAGKDNAAGKNYYIKKVIAYTWEIKLSHSRSLETSASTS